MSGRIDRKTSRDLDAAFSLLPADKAREAKDELLTLAAEGAFQRRLQLKWSEHNLNGGFRRGGSPDMIDRATQVIANSQEDVDIQNLARLAASGTPAGTLELLPGGKSFAWFLPFASDDHDKEPERLLRGLMVTEGVFRTVMDLMNPGTQLTTSEMRVLFQITAGLTPREAAMMDGISFESKRAHIKSASAKFFYADQRDLVRRVMGQLVYLLSASEGEVAHAALAESFVALHLREDARLVLKRLPGGRLIRLIECGPSDGRMVVMIHGMMFPITLVRISRCLEAEGIRLVVPIRPGFLEARPVAELAGAGDRIESTVRDLADYLGHERASPAVILGQSLDAVVAIRFANRYPQLVSRLILQ